MDLLRHPAWLDLAVDVLRGPYDCTDGVKLKVMWWRVTGLSAPMCLNIVENMRVPLTSWRQWRVWHAGHHEVQRGGVWTREELLPDDATTGQAPHVVVHRATVQGVPRRRAPPLHV